MADNVKISKQAREIAKRVMEEAEGAGIAQRGDAQAKGWSGGVDLSLQIALVILQSSLKAQKKRAQAKPVVLKMDQAIHTLYAGDPDFE